MMMAGATTLSRARDAVPLPSSMCIQSAVRDVELALLLLSASAAVWKSVPDLTSLGGLRHAQTPEPGHMRSGTGVWVLDSLQ